MGNKINPFVYSGFKMEMFTNALFGSVRCVEIDGNPWFVGNDVASCLGYGNVRDALGRHVDPEDKGVVISDTLGGPQQMVIINESGLYSLILRSNLPSARQFKHWVTHDVLPNMRKIGFSTSIDMLTQKVEELQDELHDMYSENNRLSMYNDLLEKGTISIGKMLS